jgi:hypothetical protein
MPHSDHEFAEFETDDATFDAMMAGAESAEIIAGRQQTVVVVEQDDQTRFIVTMPAGATLSVGASGSQPVGGPGTHSRGRRPAYWRRAGSEALAS